MMNRAKTLTGEQRPGRAHPVPVRVVRSLERASWIDEMQRPVHALARALVSEPRRRDVLCGSWLGHAAHPILTDLPLGVWTSSMLLDLFGGRASRPASRRLLAVGVAASVPTALTGLAEWAHTDAEDRRVGFAHAVGNTAALGLYSASLAARYRSRHATGVLLGLAGGAVVAASGHLGGHLALARNVSSRHPTFQAGTAPPDSAA